MFLKVKEFHITFGVMVGEYPELPDAGTRELRIRILKEEWEELAEAEEADDLVEISDALGDMAYLICGTAVSYGIFHTKPYVPLFHDLLKGHVPHLPLEHIRHFQKGMIDIAFEAYLAAEESNDLHLIKVSLDGLMNAVAGAAYAYSIPLLDVFNEIHRSNMSKLGEDGKPIYREDGKVLKGPSYSPPDLKSVLFPGA